MSELFRRHPINKAGAARAKRGKFLMLTMTYNLVQKGVIHSVTAMGEKKLSVCCSGEQRQCHPGGWAPGRLATGQQCEGSSAQEQGLCFLEPPGLLCIVGLHSCTGGCQHPLHCIFCLQSPSISSICVSVSAHHCLSMKSSAVPSKALLIHSQLTPAEACQKVPLQWTRGGQGIRFLFLFLFLFLFSLDPTVEILSMRKENKS